MYCKALLRNIALFESVFFNIHYLRFAISRFILVVLGCIFVSFTITLDINAFVKRVMYLVGNSETMINSKNNVSNYIFCHLNLMYFIL